MKRDGCEEITIGVESGDEETLRRIEKGITVEQVRNAGRTLKRSGVRFSAYFMISFPWETRTQIDKTVSLMKELDPHVVIFSIATSYPETELWDICVQQGLIP